MKPGTQEREDTLLGRRAAAENPVRQAAPPPTGKSRVTGPSQVRVVLQVILIIAGVALGVWALHRLASLVFVLILAALFAYVIAPLVQLAERPIRIGRASRSRRLPRAAAIAIVYVLIAGSTAGGAALLLPLATEQANDMLVRAPGYAQSILAWDRGWSRYYERAGIPLELRRYADRSVVAASAGAADTVRGSVFAIVGALSYVPWLVLIPILAFFLLKDAASLRRTIVAALPDAGQLRAHRLFEELNATLAGYVRAQLLACVLVGTLCGVGFAVIGIPYPVLLGALAGALEFIPLIGPLILAVVAAVVGALHAPILALWTVGFLGGLRIVEDYVIYPRLIRRDIHLHPLAVILGVLAGGELDGVAGVFLAVPIIAIASVVYRHWIGWRRDADGNNAAEAVVRMVDRRPAVAFDEA